jgi:hypothetical protein
MSSRCHFHVDGEVLVDAMTTPESLGAALAAGIPPIEASAMVTMTRKAAQRMGDDANQ